MKTTLFATIAFALASVPLTFAAQTPAAGSAGTAAPATPAQNTKTVKKSTHSATTKQTHNKKATKAGANMSAKPAGK
jgi:hypothetical protein